MPDFIPAAPGTMLLIHGKAPAIPIIGWTIGKSGRAEPVTPLPPVTIQHGIAYAFVDKDFNAFVDPVYKKVFLDRDEWIEFIADKDPGEAPEDGEPGAIPAAALGVAFGSKTFVKSSFWVYKDDDYNFIFEVDGGEPLPDDSRVTKSNRKDYAALKKTLPVVEVAALLGEAEDPGEVEADLDEEAEDLI